MWIRKKYSSSITRIAIELIWDGKNFLTNFSINDKRSHSAFSRAFSADFVSTIALRPFPSAASSFEEFFTSDISISFLCLCDNVREINLSEVYIRKYNQTNKYNENLLEYEEEQLIVNSEKHAEDTSQIILRSGKLCLQNSYSSVRLVLHKILSLLVFWCPTRLTCGE